ncbi:CPK2, partial [Symbiodinium necroappetens]
VRNANVTVGTRPDGAPAKLFLNISQPPEKRRKVQVAAKCKRLLMELGAATQDVDTEYSTGQVWYRSVRVASAINAGAPAGSSTTGSQGWIDLKTIADRIKTDVNTVKTHWQQLARMTPLKVLEFLKAFEGHKPLVPGTPSLSKLIVVVLQEIIVEVGIFFEDDGHWTLVCGKKAGEWRGTAIAFRSSLTHHSATIHPKGSSVVLSKDNTTFGVICIHVPHHATVDETSTILADFDSCPAMRQHRTIVGMDANEIFSHSESASAFPKGHTGRGETILTWLANGDFRFPEQQLHLPSHFPYSGQNPRRLDYLVCRGIHLGGGHVGDHRDRAHSDHEPIIGHLPVRVEQKQFHKVWGPRHLRHDFQDTLSLGHFLHGDAHHQLAAVCKAMTNPGRAMDKFDETKKLKQLRREAQRTPPGPARRTAWKEVQAMHRQEKKQWHTKLNEAASKQDWRSYRAQKHLLRTREWEHYLLDDANWQGTLKHHFEGIFYKEDPSQVTLQITEMRRELARLCKVTPWHPFTLEELQVTEGRWPRRKAAGPDGIIHEALSQLLRDDTWMHRIVYLINDIFYKGTLPELLEKGVTVLLPKTATPDGWPDTRPITISSAILKWIAQLVLRRTQHLFTPVCTLQWCAKGRQSVEMLLAIRKIARMARDWGGPFFIVKIDVRK